MGIMATPNQIRKRVNEYGARPEPIEFPQNKRGPIIGSLNKLLESDDNRYVVFGWLFTPDDEVMRPLQSKDLTPQQWNGLQKWFGVRNVAEPDADPIWENRPEFEFEVRCVLARAAYHYEISQARPVPIGRLIELPHDLETDEVMKIKTPQIPQDVYIAGNEHKHIDDYQPEPAKNNLTQEQYFEF